MRNSSGAVPGSLRGIVASPGRNLLGAFTDMVFGCWSCEGSFSSSESDEKVSPARRPATFR